MGFFAIFYLEPVNIGGIKFAIVWKVPLILFLIIVFFRHIGRGYKMPIFMFFGFLLGLKYFFSISGLEYYSTTILESMKFITFFLLIVWFQSSFKVDTLLKFGTILSIFTILSFLPFMFGFLEPLGKVNDLSKYGDLEGSSLTGIFQNPHAASIVLAFALLVLLYLWMKEHNRRLRLMYAGFLMLGVVELALTLARTGWAMFVIGAFYLSYKKFKVKHYILISIFALFGAMYTASIFQHSPLLQSLYLRLQGDTKYSDFDDAGSGRSQFAAIAIDSWQSEGFEGIVIGLGMELAKDKMGDMIGARLVAHNGFVQILQSEGILGEALLLLYMFFLFRYIRRFRNSEFYALVMSLYIAYLTAYYFQGGDYFIPYVIFAIYLAILSKSVIHISANYSRQSPFGSKKDDVNSIHYEGLK
jgi:hypothetical protein